MDRWREVNRARARLIETVDIQTAIGVRDRARMETRYVTGIRHAETHKLDLYYIDTAAPSLLFVLARANRSSSADMVSRNSLLRLQDT